MTYFKKVITLTSTTLMILLMTAGLALSAEATLKILAPWQAGGKVYKIAPHKVKVVGSFDGIMYIDSGKGDLDAAVFMCPGVQYIDLNTKKAEVTADCVISKGDSKIAYATINASGLMGALSGTFKIIGGEKHWRGIGGEGKIIIRTALGQTALNKKSGTVINAAAGLAVWPALKVTLPR